MSSILKRETLTENDIVLDNGDERVRYVLSEAVERLKSLGPVRIVLFGSRAWGDADEESDIDLYIVDAAEEIPASWSEKSRIYQRYARKVYDLQQYLPIDLVVHTRQMHRRFLERGGSFARMIQERGKVLYEA